MCVGKASLYKEMPRGVVYKKTTTTTRARPVARRYATSGHGAYRKPRMYAPSRYAVRGHGGYWDNVKARWREGGGKAKGLFEAAGNAVAGAPGGALGGLLNRGLYALTGFGDYQVRSNALLETNGPPEVVNRSNKEFVIRHREYVTDLYSSGGTANTPSPFQNQAFSINPGQTSLFTWLSSIAGKFESYRLEGMIVEYKSLYSDAVVTQNGSIGSVILATEYNAGAAPFQSKQQMENYQFAQSCKPSHSVLHPVECARSQSVLSELYVRPSALPVGEDIKTYDFGTFQFASQGIPLGAAGAPVPLGELWVSYQVALIKPKIPLLGPASYQDSGYAHFSTNLLSAGTVTAAAPFGALGSFFPSPANNITGVVFTTNSIVIPLLTIPMRYKLDIMWNGTTAANWNAPATGTFTNGQLISPTVFTGLYIIPNVGAPVASSGAWACLFIELPAIQGNQTLCTIPFQTNGTFPATGTININVFMNAVPFGTI